MTLALDGSAALAGTSVSSRTVSLTTTLTNDIIVVFVSAYNGSGGYPAGSFSVSDTAGLSWTRRTSQNTTGSFKQLVEEWWALAASPLSSDSITATFSGGSVSDMALAVIAINGANTTTPFDTNVSLPAFCGNSGPTSATVSTTNANTIVLSWEAATSSTVTPTGFTSLNQTTGALFHKDAYEIVTSQLSSVSFPDSGHSADILIFDAIQQASSGGNVYAVTIAESSTTGDADSVSAIFAVGVTESSTTGDTPGSSAVFASSVSESSTTSDAFAAVANFLASVSETSATSDTFSNGSVFAVSISETATTADTASAVAHFLAAISEAAATSDTPSATARFAVVLSEHSTTGDSEFVPLAVNVTLAEASTLTDAFTAALTAGVNGRKYITVTPYKRTTIPTDPTSYALYLRNQLQSLQQTTSDLADAATQTTDVAPINPRIATIRYATGQWAASLSGEGLYIFKSSGWTLIA